MMRGFREMHRHKEIYFCGDGLYQNRSRSEAPLLQQHDGLLLIVVICILLSILVVYLINAVCCCGSLSYNCLCQTGGSRAEQDFGIET